MVCTNSISCCTILNWKQLKQILKKMQVNWFGLSIWAIGLDTFSRYQSYSCITARNMRCIWLSCCITLVCWLFQQLLASLFSRIIFIWQLYITKRKSVLLTRIKSKLIHLTTWSTRFSSSFGAPSTLRVGNVKSQLWSISGVAQRWCVQPRKTLNVTKWILRWSTTRSPAQKLNAFSTVQKAKWSAIQSLACYWICFLPCSLSFCISLLSTRIPSRSGNTTPLGSGFGSSSTRTWLSNWTV